MRYAWHFSTDAKRDVLQTDAMRIRMAFLSRLKDNHALRTATLTMEAEDPSVLALRLLSPHS